MPTGFARVGLPRRMIVIACLTVMVAIGCGWVIVIVRGRPVMVIGVIVADVFVDVQSGRHGRGRDQRLSKQDCDEPAHGSSVLRSAGTLRKGERKSASLRSALFLSAGRRLLWLPLVTVHRSSLVVTAPEVQLRMTPLCLDNV
jgi:hypothetical protein